MKAKKESIILVLEELEVLRIINALAEADERLKGLDGLIKENWRIREKLIKELRNE